MRRALIVVLIVAAVLVVAVLALSFLIDANRFRLAIKTELTKSLGRDVKIGDLKLSILSGTVTADDLSVADDPAFSKTAFLHTKALSLSIDLWHLPFSRKLNVQRNDDRYARDRSDSNSLGSVEFLELGTKSSTPSSSNGDLALSMKSLKINGARISLTQGGGKPEILDNVSIDVKDFAPGSAFPFSVQAKIAGGGDLALEGKAGPIDPADASNTPFTASLKVTNLNLAATGAACRCRRPSRG